MELHCHQAAMQGLSKTTISKQSLQENSRGIVATFRLLAVVDALGSDRCELGDFTLCNCAGGMPDL